MSEPKWLNTCRLDGEDQFHYVLRVNRLLEAEVSKLTLDNNWLKSDRNYWHEKAISGASAPPGASHTRLSAQITQYLSTGGFWNPEAMEHGKVRDLLIACRDAFDSPQAPAADETRLIFHRPTCASILSGKQNDCDCGAAPVAPACNHDFMTTVACRHCLEWAGSQAPVAPSRDAELDRLTRALQHLSLYVAANGDTWVQRQAREYLSGVQPPTLNEMFPPTKGANTP